MLAFQVAQKAFHFLAFGVAVGGAGGLDHGQGCLCGEVADVLFGQVEHGADEFDACAREVGDGGEAADASLEEEVEHQRFRRVVEVVTERDGVTSEFSRSVIECAAAQFGAERAGRGFFPDFEHDLCDLGGDDGIGNFQFFAQFPDGGEVCAARKAHIDGNGLEGKGDRIKAAEFRKCAEQGKGVLACRDPDCDAVVRVYHAVVVECAPCPAQDSFDVFHFDLFF